MKVKDLIANLQKENQENEVYIAAQDGTDILDIFEVIEARYGNGETFTIITPVGMDDYVSPIDEVKLFKQRILADINEYRKFVEKDDKLTYNEKILKLGAIEFIKEDIQEA